MFVMNSLFEFSVIFLVLRKGYVRLFLLKLTPWPVTHLFLGLFIDLRLVILKIF